MATGALFRQQVIKVRTFRAAVGLLAALAVATIFLQPSAARGGEGRGPQSIFDDDFPSSPGTTTSPPSTPARPTPTPPAPTPPAPEQPVAPDPDMPARPPVKPPRTAPPEQTEPHSGAPDTASVTGNETAPGLFAELYDGADFGRVKEAKLVKRVRVSFERPASSVGTVLPMSFRWSGLLVVPPGGISVRFMVQSHGTAELSLDNNVLVSAHADATGKIMQPGVTTMSAGVHHVELKVSRIRYAGGQETVGLSWQPTGEEMQPVPSTVFSHLRGDELAMLKVASESEAKKARRKGTTPPPSDAELAEARKRVKAKFATLYAGTTATVRQSLAHKLGDEAGASTDPTEHYALLREAADVSAGAGDIKGAMLCVDAIVSEFKVDEPELELAVLSSGMHSKVPGAYHELGEAALQVADDASAADELETAFRAASLAETAFGAGKDEELPRAKARAKDLRDLQQQFARIAPLIKKLHDDPNDADANTKAGRFFCLSAGRWEKGLPMLAKGSDLPLKALAEAEASSPADADAQLKLGDGWWDRAASESSSSAAHCKERACFWYLQARATNAAGFPDRALQRLGVLSRTIDLLAQVDVDAVAPGSWKRDHGALIRTAGQHQEITFGYQPFGDYDFIVEYSPGPAGGYLLQQMPVNGRKLYWSLSSNYANFEGMALRAGSYGPMLRGRVVIEPGHRYTSVVQFRRTGVRAFVNGVLIREWATDYSELVGGGGGGIVGRNADDKCLALICGEADTVIYAIKVVEIPHSVK